MAVGKRGSISDGGTASASEGSFNGRTQREVLRKLADARRIAEDGGQPPSERLTVKSFLREWLAATKASVKVRTWQRYREYVEVHAIPEIEHPKVVSEMLGHTDIRTTLNLYSHVTPTMQERAAGVFDRLLGES